MSDQLSHIYSAYKSHYRWLVTILIISIISPLQSQINYNSSIEKIKEKIVETSHDSTKVDVYIEIGWALYNRDTDESYIYAKKAEELAEKIAYDKGIAGAKNLIGIYHDMKGKHRISRAFNEEALSHALNTQDSELISKIYNCIALNYATNSSTYEKAYKNYIKSLEYSSGDTIRYISTKANIAQLLMDMGQEKKAHEIEKEIIEITNGIKGEPLEIINMEFQVYEYINKGDTITAKKTLRELIQKNKNLGNNFSIIYNNFNLCNILQSEEKYTEALKVMEETEELTKENGFIEGIDKIALNKASILSQLGEDTKAISLLKKLNPSKQGNIIALENLSQLYEKKGDFKSALYYAKRFKLLNDSIEATKNRSAIAELEIMYDTERQEKENQSLKLKSIEIENKLENRNLLLEYLLAGLCIMLLIITFYYKQSNQRKKYNNLLSTQVNEKTKSLKIANENLLETNKELEAFTYVAAHDLMTPLRSITSFTGLIKKKNIGALDANTSEYFDHIEQSSRWMSDLIDDLLVFTKLDKETYSQEEISISTLIQEIKSHLKSQIDKKKAIINLNSSLDFIIGDKKRIKQVFQNLISNAIKYTNDEIQPIINIGIKETKTEILFSVSDNGIGIDEAYHEIIFDPFKRLHSKDEYEGTGIGLYICKKIITKSEGTIGLKQNQEGGTTFNFTIPKKKLSE